MADVRIQQYPLKPVLDDNDYFLIADAEDVDVNGWLKYKKVKAEDLPTIVNTAEDITIAGIQAKIAANDLTLAKFYRITDSASGRPVLLVQAVSTNSVSYQAFDPVNPLNTINYNVISDTIRWIKNETNAPQDYLGGTGIVKSTAGTISYLTDNSANWDVAFNDSIISANVTGTTTKTLTLVQQDSSTITASWSDFGGLSSVGLSMPSAFTVTNSPLTANGTIAVTGAGLASQYVRGDGTLATFPTTNGGGSSVSYYFNGGTNQGTIGGNTYYEMSKTAVIGTGADFNINANGYIAQFVTDANDPALLSIPAGNWNFEMWFSASSGGGTPSFYLELYKYDGTTLTLISSGSAAPESITNGTAIDLYTTALAVPLTALTITDRLAVRVFVNNSSRTITLHTQNGHLCQAITTFSTGLTALNGLTNQVQYFAVGTSGTDFNISSATDTHTFNLPTASAVNRGLLSSADWTAFNSATVNAITGTLSNNYVPVATGTNTLTNSHITDNGSIIKINDNATDNGLLINISTDVAYLTNTGSNNGFVATGSIVKTVNGALDRGLKLDFANNYFILENNNNSQGISSSGFQTLLGDWNDSYNGTKIFIDEGNQIIKTTNQGTDKGLKLDFSIDYYTFGAADNGENSGLLVNNNGQTDIGDYVGNNNTTFFRVDDSNQNISAYFNGTQSGLFLDLPSNHYSLGDNLNNFTTVDVFDATKIIRLNSERVQYIGQTNATIAAFTGNAAGQLLFNSDSNSFQFYNGSAWVGFGGTVTGTGTTNYMTKWSSTSGVTASTLLYDGGTFIGVNRTTSAGYLFDINGTFRTANSTYLATTAGGGVGIGLVSVDSSAQLHMSSTTKGFLMPRLTTTQMNAIGTPANGLMIYNTTLAQLHVYAGGVWTPLASGGGSGTVTSITAGTGLSGGTITTSGTIALANTAVVAGAYTSANITVDAQGRITAAANGSGGGYSAITQSVVGNRILINAPTDDTSSHLQVNGVARAARFITNSGSVYIDNVLIGRDAGLNFGTVNYSTAVGSGSQEFNTSGNQNTSVGYQSLRSLTTGIQNTAIGSDTLKASTTLSYNVAVGSLAMQNHTSGSNNTVLGVYAKQSGASGSSNSVLGAYAFQYGTGNSNVAIGQQALGNNAGNSGNDNVGIGASSLYRVSTGINNIGIGSQAGYTGTNDLTTGSNNILIGYRCDVESATESNRTFIGNNLITSTWLGGSLLIGTRTNIASSVATFTSTTKGVLLPRMTTAEINAIATPANGLMAYNTTLNKLCIFENGTWQQVTTTAM
jgi:hypothetical protein